MKKSFIKTAVCIILAVACLVPAVRSGVADAPIPLSIDLSRPAVSFGGSEKYPHSKIKNTIAKYKAENSDVIGWLLIPGTGISEPVCFSADSNISYIKRDWKGTSYPITYENWNKYPATATYLEFRSRIGESWKNGTSRNLVLYGHNWNNLREPFVIGNKEGYTMFSQLPSYTNKDFATQHPYIYFSTDELEGIWKVFAVGYCELSTQFPYNSPNKNKDEIGQLVAEWKDRSLFDFSTEVDETDRLLTLSTCTRYYDNIGQYQRFVIVARLLRDGETENDKVTVTVNPDVKQPLFSTITR